MATLDVLRRSFDSESRIGYFNAIGRYQTSLATQEKNKNCIVKMGNIWGFALRRSHWTDMQPVLEPYYKLVRGQDYRRRPHKQIRDLFQTWGFSKRETSQDSAKDIATNILGCCRVSTFFCLANYIGEKGTHSTAEHFAYKGYANTQIYQGDIPSSFTMTPAAIDLQVALVKEAWQLKRQV